MNIEYVIEKEPAVNKFVKLIVFYCREDGVDYCINQNILNDYVDEINIFCLDKDIKYVKRKFAKISASSPKSPRSPRALAKTSGDNVKSSQQMIPQQLSQQQLNKIKIHKAPNNACPTYAYIFEFANKTYDQSSVVGYINNDIFLDNNINLMSIYNLLDTSNQALCISRYETDTEKIWKDQKLSQLCYGNIQDCWFLKTPIKHVDDCDFHSYNNWSSLALNYRLKSAGYQLYNTNNFKIYHLQNVKKTDIIQDKIIKENGYYLPEVESFDISIDLLVKILKLTPTQLYELKCRILTEYIPPANNTSKQQTDK